MPGLCEDALGPYEVRWKKQILFRWLQVKGPPPEENRMLGSVRSQVQTPAVSINTAGSSKADEGGEIPA